MHRLFYNQPFQSPITITDPEHCHHFSTVLQLKPGEHLYLVNKNQVAKCEIATISKSEICCEIIEISTECNELETEITLGFGPLKNDNTQLVIQKAVELGASEIHLINFIRNISKFDSKKAEKKNSKFQKISYSAAQQSRRNIVPNITVNVDLSPEYLQGFDLVLVCYENEDNNRITNYKSKILSAKKILVLVGPEGGIDKREIEKLTANCFLISLGKRILRAETASISVLSILGNLIEENNENCN